jgi:teichoic acid transport system permease protein
VLLQTMFNTGAALLVARMGGAVADVSELIPFFLRISRYFCGVMYLIITVTYRFPTWVGQVLSLNPFAVYISLIRVGFMGSYRADSAGNQPYNYGLCQQFLGKVPGSTTGGHILAGTRVPTWFISPKLLPASQPSSIVIPKTGPLSKISNVPLQAYCHAIVTNNDLWIAAAAWAVVLFSIGIVFFWRAEHLYGRG